MSQWSRPTMVTTLRRCLLIVIGSALTQEPMAVAANSAERSEEVTQDLTELRLEELMAIEVTSVSKKVQSVAHTASAVFVITQEDIRRSGANSIPEALRMAPGLHVARIDSQKWSVTSRGFSGRFADDLLVLIDGRTVYSPLVAGTFWEVQDLPLEDIDRIEVIRGPGGTLWGPNAVNGAVHIITKKTKDTQGALITAGGGTEERGFATMRYGGHIGESLSFRLYGKGFGRDGTSSATGSHDDWRMGRTGGRLDWDVTSNDSVTLQGDYYNGQAGQQTLFPTTIGPSFSTSQTEDLRMSGGNILGRWKHTFTQQHDLTLQFYYDRTRRDELSFKEIRNTFDVDFQHRFQLPLNQEIVWGALYRVSGDRLRNSESLSFTPDDRSLRMFSVFVQDEITLFHEKVRLTVGTKYLKHTFTGGLIQPNVRLLYNPTPDQAIWAAVTHANRIPSRFERDGRLAVAGTPTELVQLQGNPAARSENLWGFEAGYRAQIGSTLSVDAAAFYNHYKYSSGEQELSESLEQIQTNVTTRTYGGELAGEWRVLRWWRLRPAFTYLQVRRSAPEGIEVESGEDPVHQFSMRSLMELTDTIEFDTTFRFVDRLPGIRVSNYQNLDIRLGWRPIRNLELSLVGHNLLEAGHVEFKPEFIQTGVSYIQRGLFAKVTWRF